MIAAVIRVMCPGHITGFFEICESDDARYMGSRGAGICISKGVETKLTVKESENTEINVKINGKSVSAPVTRAVVERFLKFVNKPLLFEIEHKIGVPISAGFGASGAGALSTAIALNKELNLKMTRNAAATIAHISEIENSTGLGDVIAQTYGGIEIRVEPGAPGIGRIDQIIPNPNTQLLCMTLGQLETKAILTDPAARAHINQAGRQLVQELIQNATIENFIALSRKFMEKSGLLSKNLRDLLMYINDVTSIPASMVMLGESLFMFVNRTESEEIQDKIQEYSSKLKVFICDIDLRGPRIIEAR
ncbi:MAG: pantoate kinase [Candidatus Helarchaeota archaeon]